MMTVIAFVIGIGVAPLVAEVPGVKQLHNVMFSVAKIVRAWVSGKPE